MGQLKANIYVRRLTRSLVGAATRRLKAAVIVPYDLELCKEYARVKCSLDSQRNAPGNDLWIATCAIRHSIPLVTHNRKHFDGIPRLVLISQVVPPAVSSPGKLFT